MKTKKTKKIPHLRILIKGKPVSVDGLVYIALISPVMALPQLYMIFTTDAKGVSVITWATFLVVASVWLAYAVHHKLKPLMIVQSCWIFIDSAIVLALVLKK